MIADIDPLYGRNCWQEEDIIREVVGDIFIGYFMGDDSHYVNVAETDINHFKWIYNSWFVGANFWDEIKNQVHIFPSLYVDFGLVLSQQKIEYYLWNSFTDKSVEVQLPVVSGDDGTSFVITGVEDDFTLLAGKGIDATLTVYTDGPISSETWFLIVATPEDMEPLEYVLDTKATRIIAFPFWPNWDSDIKFSLDFCTVISTSTMNYEQRRPLMNKPQRTIEFTINDNFGLVENATNFAEDKNVGIPIFHEKMQLVGIDSDKYGITVMENLSELWNVSKFCDYVILIDKSTDKFVAKKVTGISGSNISIETPFLDDFNINSTFVFPMIIGYFDRIKPEYKDGNNTVWSISMKELIGLNQPNLITVSMPESFTRKFDWSKDVNSEKSLYRNIGGFDGTAQTIYSKYPKNKQSPRTYSGTLILKSRAEIYSMMDFLCAAKGRWKKFEYLWPINNFKVLNGEYQGVNQLKVKNNYFSEQFSKLVNKKIVIRYKQYTLETTLQSSTTTSDFTLLTFSDPTTFQILDEDCDTLRIEHYKTVRLDLDSLTFNFKSGKVATLEIRFMEVYE